MKINILVETDHAYKQPEQSFFVSLLVCSRRRWWRHRITNIHVHFIHIVVYTSD